MESTNTASLLTQQDFLGNMSCCFIHLWVEYSALPVDAEQQSPLKVHNFFFFKWQHILLQLLSLSSSVYSLSQNHLNSFSLIWKKKILKLQRQKRSVYFGLHVTCFQFEHGLSRKNSKLLLRKVKLSCFCQERCLL